MRNEWGDLTGGKDVARYTSFRIMDSLGFVHLLQDKNAEDGRTICGMTIKKNNWAPDNRRHCKKCYGE